MEEVKRFIKEGTITELRKISDGKVTMVITKEKEIPDISFFTKNLKGEPLFSILEVGKRYVLTYVNNNGYFNLVQAKLADTQPSAEVTEQIKENLVDKDRRITRMACLNTAAKIIEIKYQNRLNENDTLAETIEVAKELEKWVYRWKK